jgi:uncharacterized protein (TIGR02594 family)
MSDPKWYTTALRDLGLKEKPGAGSHPRVLEMFEAAGHPEVRDDATAWCSAAMNAWMVWSGIKGTGALTARSWMNWGKGLDWKTKTLPRGAVVVFPRGSSAWQGHVAMIHKDTGGPYVEVLGGNQSDQVSIVRYRRSSIIAARWPDTAATSTEMRAGAVGLATGVASDTIDQIAPLLADVQGSSMDLLPYLPMVKWVLLAVSVASLIYGGYKLWKRFQPKPLPEIPPDVQPIEG